MNNFDDVAYAGRSKQSEEVDLHDEVGPLWSGSARTGDQSEDVL